MARALDQLAEYDSFQSEISPILKQAIKEGWDAERIKRDPKIKALLVSRLLSIALNDKNPSAALSAIKEFTDRSEGKVAEKREVKMELETTPDEELDQKLQSLLDAGIAEETDSIN